MIVYHSIPLPEDFLSRMRTLLGEEEYEAFLDSYGQEQARGLRLNTLREGAETFLSQYRERFGLEPVPWCGSGFYYRAETRPGRHPLHEAGIYYIQEPSAMAVVELLDLQPGDRVLDLCAAPGGKSTQAAARLGGRGLLVSNEIHPTRARILSQNMERMGVVNALVTNADAAALGLRFAEFFDCIIVDAPCSGEGMFRKEEEARAEWSPENVRRCAARQQEILDHAAAMLRPGGRLVYSTCTFAPEEDEGGIAAFLGRHPEFEIVSRHSSFPESLRFEPLLPGTSPGRPAWGGDLPQLADTVRIWPHLSRGEGHFMALLEKSAKSAYRVSSGETNEKTGRAGKARKNEAVYWRDRAGIVLVRKWLEETLIDLPEWWDAKRLLLFGDQVYQAPEGIPSLEGLRVLRAGLQLGTLKKNRFEPSHALALALNPRQVRRTVHFDPEGEEIADWLRGGTLRLEECAASGKHGAQEALPQNGWTLVCANSYPLGWGKAAGSILKNHYPKGLRLP